MKRAFKISLAFLLAILMMATTVFADNETNLIDAIKNVEDEISETQELNLTQSNSNIQNEYFASKSALDGVASGETNDEGIMLVANSDYKYIVNRDNTITITEYVGTATNVNIPSVIDGKTVTEICDVNTDNPAFYGKSNITSVVIPNTITSIGKGAFANCSNLSSITIGNSVRTIGDNAFQNCAITELRIPASVNSLSVSVFLGCSKLSKIEVDGANANYSSQDGILFNKDKSTLIKYPSARPNTNYTIPSSVKTLGDESFRDNKTLTSITVPNTVNTVKDWVFHNCTGLKTVLMPASITKLGYGTFQSCTNLTSATISCNVEKLPYLMFANCTNLTSVDLSNCKAKSTDSRNFYYCNNLTSVKLPNNLEILTDYTFSYCNKISNLSIPSTVVRIGGDFNFESPNLRNFNVPNGLISDGEGGFIKAVNVTVSGNYKYDYVREVLNIVNSERAKVGASALTLDQSLTDSAMERALETSILFEHTRPNTSSCFTVNSKAFGENIAAGSRTPSAVMNNWMNSPGHKANILGANYKSIGIGCFESDGMIYWVQLFGTGTGSGNPGASATQVTKTKSVYCSYVERISSNLYTNSNVMSVGETKEVPVYLTNSGWSYARVRVSGNDVKFSSSNSNVVTISGNGELRAVGGGSATITISLAGTSVSYPITVNGSANNQNQVENNNSIPPQFMNIVFNYKFYADKYPDLKAVFGYNEEALRNHYLTCGIKEGRQASPVFDVRYYLSNNEDLRKAFGSSNYEAALNHFVTCGYKELRKSSNEYYGRYYINKYADLKRMDGFALIEHYLANGRNEGRRANEGNYTVQYAKEDITNYLFDSRLYYNLYADLRNVIGYNESALKEHYLTCGIKEGRTASVVFDVRFYLKKYADLRNAFGANNYEAAYHHFINSGIHEGRVGSDYFDSYYYLKQYKDLTNVFGKSYSSGLIHFVSCGLNEGRMGSTTFNVYAYRKNYADLRNAFGNNMYSYYEHYIVNGKYERRKAK